MRVRLSSRGRRQLLASTSSASMKVSCEENLCAIRLPSNGIAQFRLEDSNVRMDFSEVPDAQRGPINCPFSSTVSAARITLAMLAGGAQETPNEGHFRALEVVTRPGSMFHPVEPQPCYLYGWPLM